MSAAAPGPARKLAAWGVHLLTASSVPAGILALRATVNGDASAAFLWMAYTIAIDSIDGTLARAVGVKEVLPWVDGARLDDIVDYFTYVVVPVFFLLQMRLLPPGAGAAAGRAGDRGERLRVQPDGGEDGRPLLHRLPVVLEHRRVLPLRRWAGRRR